MRPVSMSSARLRFGKREYFNRKHLKCIFITREKKGRKTDLIFTPTQFLCGTAKNTIGKHKTYRALFVSFTFHISQNVQMEIKATEN